MPEDEEQSLTLYDKLLAALSLVYDGIALLGKALLQNPTAEQKRRINRRILRLEAERAEISAKLDALEADDTTIKGPTAAQVRKIAELSGEVESMTTANLTLSGARALTGKKKK